MKKILLASASKVFLRKNTNLLLNLGFGLFSTASGAEALKLHEEHSFDLFIVDFKLEDMCGCTLSSLIRREDKVPIILTCHNLPGSIERVKKSGASVMFIKPIDTRKLKETIGGFLDLQIVRSDRVEHKVEVLSKSFDQEFYCLSHNISNTGILLETKTHLSPGSRIICQFALTEYCEIKAEAEINRCLTSAEFNNLYGVKFINLPVSYRRAIDNFIASIPYSGSSSQNITNSHRISSQIQLTH